MTALNDNLTLNQQLKASLAVGPGTAASLAREIGYRYDGSIPPEAMAAIAAAEQAEREAKITADLSMADLRRFHTAKQFTYAKLCFKRLCSLTKQGTIRRDAFGPGQRVNTFMDLQSRARMEAMGYLEAWARYRADEKKHLARAQ